MFRGKRTISVGAHETSNELKNLPAVLTTASNLCFQERRFGVDKKSIEKAMATPEDLEIDGQTSRSPSSLGFSESFPSSPHLVVYPWSARANPDVLRSERCMRVKHITKTDVVLLDEQIK
jgi:hypothetical protein